MMELNVSKFNERKRTIELESASDREVWLAIRYLDFEVEDKAGTRNLIVALLAILLIIGATLLDLQLRGL